MKSRFVCLLFVFVCLFSSCSQSSAPSSSGSLEPSAASTSLSTSSQMVSELSPSSVASAFVDDDKLLASYLDGLVAALNDPQGDNLYYYSLDENGVFFTISMPAFDYFLSNLDLLSASDLDAARKIALDFVSGSFAEDLISHIRTNGGASKSVYITLGCNRGICMCSRDLSVFIDNLKK